MNREINWKKGSGSLIIMTMLCLLSVVMLVLYMTVFNVEYTQTVALTRTDAIAESTAVYAQSYDYKYNKSQAEIMANLLTMYNNTTSDVFNIATEVSFPEDNVLTVTTLTSMPFMFGSTGAEADEQLQNDTVYARASATVESVDIYGHVLVVPEDLTNGGDDTDAIPDDETILP